MTPNLLITPVIKFSEQITFKESYYKKAIVWEKHRINLANEHQCFEALGFKPGTILHKSLSDPSVVVGLQPSTNTVWVGNPLNLKEIYPIKGIQCQEDLKKRGYQWITSAADEAARRAKRQRLAINDAPDCILHMLRIFRQQVDCDVFFQIGEEKIGAHTCVLKENSSYFRRLLEGKFKGGIQESEGRSKVITIQNCDLEEFKAILTYFYSGLIELNRTNILVIAILADHYLIDKLKEHCKDSMPFFLNCHSPLAYITEALRYGSEFYLLPIIECFIYRHLDKILQGDSSTVADLSLEALVYLIQRSPSNLKKYFFQIALFWLQIEEMPKRLDHLIKDILPLLPQDSDALFCYGNHLANFIQIIDNQKQIKEWLSCNAQHPVTQIMYGLLLQNLGQHKEAEDILQLVVSLDTQNNFIATIYACTLYFLKQREFAKETLELILKIRPDNVCAFNVYAEILFQLVPYELAISNLSFRNGVNQIDISN